MAAMKVETDSIASIIASQIGRAMILYMYVNTFKTDDIVFIGTVEMCRPIIFIIRVSLMIIDNITQ